MSKTKTEGQQYWKLRRFPTVEESKAEFVRHCQGVVFWSKMIETTMMMQGQELEGETANRIADTVHYAYCSVECLNGTADPATPLLDELEAEPPVEPEPIKPRLGRKSTPDDQEFTNPGVAE